MPIFTQTLAPIAPGKYKETLLFASKFLLIEKEIND